jgi:hypothetical protein
VAVLSNARRRPTITQHNPQQGDTMKVDTDKIIEAIAALRSAVQSGEDMSDQLRDVSNAALVEIQKVKATFREMATEQAENEGRRTMYVQTDGGVAGLAAKHGIDLVVTPETEEHEDRTALRVTVYPSGHHEHAMSPEFAPHAAHSIRNILADSANYADGSLRAALRNAYDVLAPHDVRPITPAPDSTPPTGG